MAVLAIDPSSKRSGGSILGDKTRMDLLGVKENAYVRPSPTKGVLGGVALNTGEVIMLTERSGYKATIVETVGLGQSEIEIDNVVDFVVYVVPPGSGDSLQGAKKGIMEVADLVVINKYDGDFKKVCKGLKGDISRAMHLTAPKHEDWIAPVELVSAATDYNVNSIWDQAWEFKKQVGDEYLLERRRQ